MSGKIFSSVTGLLINTAVAFYFAKRQKEKNDRKNNRTARDSERRALRMR